MGRPIWWLSSSYYHTHIAIIIVALAYILTSSNILSPPPLPVHLASASPTIIPSLLIQSSLFSILPLTPCTSPPITEGGTS